ncbi:ABC transporter permease [Methylobacillus flagellatus]|uniref:ABC transporter permease n=1 Tax=Methylobacillus flagellatus TaxID=405 RepID=UPI002853A820|nr:ABC transporter permease [Methylobacillus flagellatus]MDR5172708.1 ABC transporter permease [Methylobacillus flagellatus]
MNISAWTKKIRQNSQIGLGFTLSAGILLLALLGPWLAPHSPLDLVGPRYGSPDANALLGYDYLGHDVWSRLLSGGLSLVWMSIAASVIALVSGALIGMVAGFFRGRIDQTILWWSDVFLAFPNLILILLVVAMLGRDPWLIVIIVSIAFLPGVIRLSRSITLGIAQQEYIEATTMMGYSTYRILLREILPNISMPLLIHLGTMLSWAVGILAGLSFLGYGVEPPAADWGLMVNENRAGLQIQPYAVLAPAILIALFALGTNLLAEGLGRAQSGIKEAR